MIRPIHLFLAFVCIGWMGIARPSGPNTDWAFTGGVPASQQYSPLDQINSTNIGSLGLLWYSDLGVGEGLVGNPLVKDGVVYQSAPRGRAIATDASTGKTLWLFDPGLVFSNDKTLWFANFTRGLALDDARVYVATGCELYAIDRRKGTQLWHSKVCDPQQEGGVVTAPVVGDGKVFIGVQASLGIGRGFAAAHDAATGKELWRFYAVPGDPAKPQENKQLDLALKTWGDRYWIDTRGGAAVWGGMLYDPTTHLFIFGTGNPDVDGHEAQFVDKAMLFSNCLIAVNASTGKYAWHLQETTGDVFHPGDATAHMMLADLPFNGTNRHVLLQAAKNGYFYVIDAKTGKFLSANNYVPVDNYNPIDPKTGTLSFKRELRYWEYPAKGMVMQPGGWGAHTWELSSYSARTGLVYIPALIAPYGFFDEKDAGYERHSEYGFTPGAKYQTHGLLIAWDPLTQTARWHIDYRHLGGGVLSTAGGVVFQGAEGSLNAYDAPTGKKLWGYRTDSVIRGGPSTAMIDGKQLIFVPSGDGNGTASGKYPNSIGPPETMTAPSRLLAFAIGGKAVLPPSLPKVIAQPARARQPADLAARGKVLFAELNCSGCHGHEAIQAGNGRVPDLRNIREQTLEAMPQILRQGLLTPLGMPTFADLSDEDIRALQAYIVNQAWNAFDAQKK